MNGDGPAPSGRAETLNSLVRAVCVLVLLTAFSFAYVWGVLHDRPVVDNAAFIGILTLALTWFFKSRDEQQSRKDAAPPSPSSQPLPPTTGGPS